MSRVECTPFETPVDLMLSIRGYSLGFYMPSTFIYEYLATICIDILSQLPLPYLSLNVHTSGFLCVSIHCKIIEGFFFWMSLPLSALICFQK